MKRLLIAILCTLMALACAGCAQKSAGSAENSDEYVGICVRQRSGSEAYDGEPHPIDGETIILASEDDSIGFEASQAFGDVHGSYKIFDKSDECSCTANLYFWNDRGIYGIENVYRKDDGTLYATGGESFSGTMDGYTYVTSQTNPNGKSKIDKLGFDVTFVLTEAVESAELLEYSSSDELLRRTPIDFSSLENVEMRIGTDADYAVVAQHMTGGKTRRDIAEKPYDGDTLSCRILAPRDDGYCVPVWVILTKDEAI